MWFIKSTQLWTDRRENNDHSPKFFETVWYCYEQVLICHLQFPWKISFSLPIAGSLFQFSENLLFSRNGISRPYYRYRPYSDLKPYVFWSFNHGALLLQSLRSGNSLVAGHSRLCFQFMVSFEFMAARFKKFTVDIKLFRQILFHKSVNAYTGIGTMCSDNLSLLGWSGSLKCQSPPALSLPRASRLLSKKEGESMNTVLFPSITLPMEHLKLQSTLIKPTWTTITHNTLRHCSIRFSRTTLLKTVAFAPSANNQQFETSFTTLVSYVITAQEEL